MALRIDKLRNVFDMFSIFLFNVTFYPFLILFTLLSVAVLTPPLVFLRLFIGWRKTLFLVRHLIRMYGFVLVRGVTFPFVRFVYQDAEKDQKAKACVYVCNHRSSSDAFLMANLKGEMVQVVNRWPFKIPLLGWVANIAGYINVRSMSFEEFELKTSRLLSEGVSIIAFPEGTRSKDCTLGQFNGAVFRVALKMKAPIIPICLSGNQFIPEKGSFILHPGKIEMHKMARMEWKQYQSMSAFKLKNHVRNLLQKEVDQLEKNELRL